jgi:hypothetical protein
MAAPSAIASSSLPLRGATLVAHRRRELAYARALGVGMGIFLLFWAPLSLARWEGSGPSWAYVEMVFYFIFGLFLVFPFNRVKNVRLWRRLLGVFAVMSVLFIFVLVFDVLYVAKLYVEVQSPPVADDAAGQALYVYTEDSAGTAKLPFPALNCALVFLGLMQVPVVLFSRYPEKMD